MKKVLVTAAPPTPNGDLHLGHLSGPYLGADIHTRYLKMRGTEAYYICGTDDHQSYVSLKAEQIGLTPTETASRFSEEIEKTLQAAHIEVDVFVHPQLSSSHSKLVQAFFETLYSEGKLVAKEAPCPYCTHCEKYLAEAFIRGICPHCGVITGGNACEVCGRPSDYGELGDVACNKCGGKPELRSLTRLYFPLGNYEQQLNTIRKMTH